MARLRRVEMSEVLQVLAEVEPFDPHRVPHDNLFLCALGFEDRLFTIPEHLIQAGYRAASVWYLTYGTNQAANEANREQLLGYLNHFSDVVNPLNVDESDFPSKLQSILNSLKSVRGRPPTVTFEISCTANRAVVATIAVLMDYDIDLRLVYTEAAVYHPTLEEYQADPEAWTLETNLSLERGVLDIVVSRAYPGADFDPIPDALIVLPTFKADRTRAFIGHVDPSLIENPQDKIFWLLGLPHLDEDRWRVDALVEINNIKDQYPQYQASTFHYKETLATLEMIYRRLENKAKISLSPLGSKLQAVAVSMFCRIHPDVRVVFVVPKEYNSAHYTIGAKAVWEIPLGPLSNLRPRLDSIGSLIIDDD